MAKKHYGNLDVYGVITVGADISASQYTLPHYKGNDGETIVMVNGEAVFTNVAPYIDIAQVSGGYQLVESVNYLISSLTDISGSIDTFTEMLDTPKPSTEVNSHEGEIIIVNPNASTQTEKISYSGFTINDIKSTLFIDSSGLTTGKAYRRSSDGNSFIFADKDTEENAAAVGIAESPTKLVLTGKLLGSGFNAGHHYFLGSNGDIITPEPTFTAGEVRVYVGTAITSTEMLVDIDIGTVADISGDAMTAWTWTPIAGNGINITEINGDYQFDVISGGTQTFAVNQFTTISFISGSPTQITLDASQYTSGDILLEGYGKIMIPTNMQNGQSINFLVTQSTSPYNWTLQYETGILFPGGVMTPVTTGVGGTSTINILKIRNTYLASGTVNFS